MSSSPLHQHLTYRPEIDGLRAVAVLPVVFYHAGFAGFSGGFIGVDIFFVISGFLITSIILEQQAKGTFQLLSFYERRARRLLPALFLVMASTLPAAWIVLRPTAMEDFCASLLAVLFFSSNILFAQQNDYFAPAAEEIPWLHSWSLAVEEQYYIVFPLLLMLLWRYRSRYIPHAIVLGIVLSFGLSEWGWRHFPEVHFYLAPTRAWELLSGAAVAFFLGKKTIPQNIFTLHILPLLGLGFLLLGFVTIHNGLPAPSFYTVLPVIGTLLIIMFATKGSLVASILSHPILVQIGLISYSAYLWHQPVFAFTRITSGEPPSPLIMISLCISIMGLSYLSWRFVEKPCRNRLAVPTRHFAILMLTSALLLGSFAIWGILSNGFATQRFDRTFLALNEPSFLRSQSQEQWGDLSQKPTWMLIGDSHADSLQESFGNQLRKRNISALVRTMEGCPPAMDLIRQDSRKNKPCPEHYRNLLDEISTLGIKNVLISARFALYFNTTRFDNGEGGVEQGKTSHVLFDHLQFADTPRPLPQRQKAIEDALVKYFSALLEKDVRLFVISSIPEVGWDVPKRLHQTQKPVTTQRQIFDQRIQALKPFYEKIQALPHTRLLFAEDVFCDSQKCFASEEEKPLYFDNNHLSIWGANRLFEHISSDIWPSKTNE